MLHKHVVRLGFVMGLLIAGGAACSDAPDTIEPTPAGTGGGSAGKGGGGGAGGKAGSGGAAGKGNAGKGGSSAEQDAGEDEDAGEELDAALDASES